MNPNAIYGAIYNLLNLPKQAVTGVDNAVSGMGQNITQLAQNLHLAPQNAAPTPQSQLFNQQQTNTPGFFQWQRANQGNLQGQNANQQFNLYQSAVNSPGGHAYGTNAPPLTISTPTPQPTRMPTLTQVPQQVLGTQSPTQASNQPVVNQGQQQSQQPPLVLGMPTQIPGLTLSQSQKFINNISGALPVTRKYGIPDAVVAGQAALESGNGQSPAGQYNFWGLKSNSHPGFANFDNIQQAATYYAQTVTNHVPNIKNMTPSQVMYALQGNGTQNYDAPGPSDNGDPYTYSKKVMNTGAWKAFGGD